MATSVFDEFAACGGFMKTGVVKNQDTASRNDRQKRRFHPKERADFAGIKHELYFLARD